MTSQSVELEGLAIVGYADRLGGRPGDTVRVMVSTIHPIYRAELVHLVSAETDRNGSGYREEPVASYAPTTHPGRVQAIRPGSCVIVPDKVGLDLPSSFTLQAWINPTTPRLGEQILLARSSVDGDGFALGMHPERGLVLAVTRNGTTHEVATGVRFDANRWYFVAAACDPVRGVLRVVQRPTPAWPVEPTAADAERTIELGGWSSIPTRTTGPIVLAARQRHGASDLVDRPGDGSAHRAGSASGVGPFEFEGHFNGRIDRPLIVGAALDSRQLDLLYADVPASDLGLPLIAAWDFAADIASDRVRDTGPHGLHGRVHNLPTRAVTDHTWTGQSLDWTVDPGPYAAIHFHDDDLDDAGWDADFELTIPDGLRSGFYAVKLTAGGDAPGERAARTAAEDHVPLFVAAPRQETTSDLLFLVPTNTYLAYANLVASQDEAYSQRYGLPHPYPLQPEDVYAAANRLRSLYDHHSDGTGISYSSRLRPIVNMRPKMNDEPSVDGLGYAHGLKADLHVAGWLAARHLPFDVATDEDLDREGATLLGRYRVLLTGTHPEYWTGAMLDALEHYIRGGGRVIYLGGNGFYWVTSYDPVRPHVIEVRRWAGTRAWTAQVGEYRHSTTGELGGLWRERGRPPQRLVGVGFTAQADGAGRPFERTEASRAERVAWIFEGVGDDELIGDTGLVMEAAAGFEIDRVDENLGSPRHAVVVATATGFSDSYQHVVEEVRSSNSRQGGPDEPRVRADMVFYETPGDGAVFSVGSISYGGSLPINGYDNAAARVAENVVRRFLEPGPLTHAGRAG